jgi:tetratricopeptide (TPR) repeat protein
MRKRADGSARWRRRATVVASAWIACGCGGFGTPRPAAVETRDASGFSITERIRVGPGVRADFERAVTLLEQEQYERGIELLNEVTEAEPELTAAHIDLGIAYARVGDLARAEASLARALELNSRHPVAHNELGIVYRRTGRFAEARRSYERALALHPGFHLARLNLAILCDLYVSDVDCALHNYEAYTQAVPGDAAAAMWLADLRTRAGR